MIICDVGNAACAIIATPSSKAMMIDCGSNKDKENPVDLFKRQKDWLGIEDYHSNYGKHPLFLLHITHPDSDHVRNSERVKKELFPYLLKGRWSEEFPDRDTIDKNYLAHIDSYYRGNPVTFECGCDINEMFQIPMNEIKSNENLNSKIRNNSSIIRFIKHKGIKILFGGDLEEEGWEWLINNNRSFMQAISNGVDVYISAHHGHKSGFSQMLFDLIGKVKVVIHSKASEGNAEGTDVASQYSNHAEGINYKNLNDKEYYSGKVLTTRSNGNIYIEIADSGLIAWTDKASSNHLKMEKTI